MTNTYVLRSPVYFTNASFRLSFVRDALPEQRKRELEFHVRSNDYFGTLAAILSLIADSLAEGSSTPAAGTITTLNELREDLVYLQRTCTIRKK